MTIQQSAVTSESSVGATHTEFDALNQVIVALRPLDDEARRRIIDAAITFLGIRLAVSPGFQQAPPTSLTPLGAPAPHAPFSENTQMSAKEFVLEKQPRTDVERIACLAYYLTHYRGTPHFKTIDLSLLNTEAAQPKFANAAYSTNNAVKMGYLVPSTKGQRQLSAIGERFVRELPDREAAKAALEAIRRRPRRRPRQTFAEDEE